MRVVTLTLILMCAACGAEVQPAGEPSEPVTTVEDVTPVTTDREPPRLYEEAAGSAAPSLAGAGGAGGSAGAPVVVVEPMPEPEAGSSGTGTGGVGGTSGAPVAGAAGSPVEPEPMLPPAQPERFCKILPGQRYAGQTLGCTDTYSRTAFHYLTLSWRIPSTEAASGTAIVGCSEYEASPCEAGHECRAVDTRENGVTQIGVCL